MVILREIFDVLKFGALLVTAGWLCNKISNTPIVKALNDALTPEPWRPATRKHI